MPTSTREPTSRRWPWLLLAAALAIALTWRCEGSGAGSARVDYSDFYDWAAAGQVESVTIRGQSIEGTLRDAKVVGERSITRFRTTVPAGDDDLLPLLREQKVTIAVAEEGRSVGLQILLAMIPWLLLLGIWVWLSRRAASSMGGGAGGSLRGLMSGRGRKFDATTSVTVGFDDVAGLASAKRDLQEVVEFLKQPERFRRLGGKVPRGVLLIGPPGTGKTLLARAVAGESGVPFYSISASEFIELFVGVGAARVRELFAEAKRNEPAIIFIDEIDAVGRSRGAGLGGGHDEREQTLNQLLSEMDGFHRNDLTIVLAATNRPDVLDPALLRPGRFDRRVVVGRPELAARQAILVVHTRDKPLADDVDLESIARNAAGFSGADLANLVNEAALIATRRGADAIAAADVLAAFDKIVLGDPRESKLDAEERRRVAVHEAGHALVAHLSPGAEPLERVSIIPRGMSLGATRQTPAGDRHLMTRSQLEGRLRVFMGGYAAERTVLGEVSTGAENDLKEASNLALEMVAHYGMSETLGPVYVEHREEHPFLGQRIATESATSDATTHVIESEARMLLRAAEEQAATLIARRRAALDRLVDRLLDVETLERDDLVALLGDPAAGEPTLDLAS